MLIKICGITTPEAAVRCFECGADWVGLVHYPPSPRHIGVDKMREILDGVDSYRKTSGTDKKIVLVVVNDLPQEFLNNFDERIDFVQCYGDIPNSVSSDRLIPVVKERKQLEELMSPPNENNEHSLYALEMSHGTLPGGNGVSWNWDEARPFCRRFPTLLAGGITAENVGDAIRRAEPYGIDVSSGAESSPGVKDFEKISRLIKIVRNIPLQ
jgi:phosphoribosylanthranilate isomerase